MKPGATVTGYPLTYDGVRQALEALGNTTTLIADRLLAGGHKGQPANAAYCPVANYLASKFPQEKVSVGANQASVGLLLDVDLPEPVALFVKYFDDADSLYACLDVEQDPS